LKKDVGLVEAADYYLTQTLDEWWDNGGEPIWITAVNQVSLKKGCGSSRIFFASASSSV